MAIVDLGTVTGAATGAISITGINVPAGATIIAMCTNGSTNSNAPVPVDSVNGAYTSINEQLLAGGSLNGSCRMSYFPSSAAITGGTLTFTGNGTGGFGSSMTAFYVYPGLGSLRTSGGHFTASVTSAGNAVVGDFVVGGVGCSGATGQDTANGFTSPFTATSYVCGGHKTATTATTQTYAPSGITGNAAAVIAVFAPPTTSASGAAEMDGAASVAFPGAYSVVGAGEMDGAASVAFAGRTASISAAQMDGLTTVAFGGAVGSGKLNANGAATVAFAGRVTGGFHVGAAQMDGAAVVAFTGTASTLTRGAAAMNGQGSMLAVAAATPLPPHAPLLAAGI